MTFTRVEEAIDAGVEVGGLVRLQRGRQRHRGCLRRYSLQDADRPDGRLGQGFRPTLAAFLDAVERGQGEQDRRQPYAQEWPPRAAVGERGRRLARAEGAH